MNVAGATTSNSTKNRKSLLEDVLSKIGNKTVSVHDFNNLIDEALAKSAVERVQRRVRKTPTDSHIDAEGHQQLELPEFGARVAPKLEKDGSDQMTHRGKMGHKQSTRTQRRQQ